ncbi:MAG: S-layer homology domain-containing protein [Clostridiales bacterium]|nr:S-layer homology domain-containing protein [Clostridiales bacterium]
MFKKIALISFTMLMVMMLIPAVALKAAGEYEGPAIQIGDAGSGDVTPVPTAVTPVPTDVTPVPTAVTPVPTGSGDVTPVPTDVTPVPTTADGGDVTPVPTTADGSVGTTVTTAPVNTATPTATSTPTATPTPAVTLSLNKINAVVACDKVISLNATLTNSTDNVVWTTSDKKVATVDAYGNIKAKMAGTVAITASAAGKSASCTVTVLYKDVTNSKDFWYGPTNYLTAAGIVKGYDKQTMFKPANNCTRAQMVTFIWRLMGEPAPKAATCKFSDVKEKDYFYKACIWGNENGIVEGYKDGTFGPQIVCARKHAVTFLWRLAGKPAPKDTKNKFSDVKKTDYFYKATLWASEQNILAGYSDGTFRPDGDCLRRQMVTFLYKYDKNVNKKG